MTIKQDSGGAIMNKYLQETHCGDCSYPLTRDEQTYSYWGDPPNHKALCGPCRMVAARKQCVARGYHAAHSVTTKGHCVDLVCECGDQYHTECRDFASSLGITWTVERLPN